MSLYFTCTFRRCSTIGSFESIALLAREDAKKKSPAPPNSVETMVIVKKMRPFVIEEESSMA